LSGAHEKVACMSAYMAIVVGVAATVASAQVAAMSFSVKSPAFQNQGVIPQAYSYSGFGCTGRNVSPPIEWTPGPAGTKSYALTVFDPDARQGVGWWHWVVFDIPPTVTELAGNAGAGSGAYLPKGAVQGRNDFQAVGWGGPCPPPGPAHHYVFTVYALDVAHVYGTSELTSGLSLVAAIKGHVLAQARLVGRFSR
jgi:Raf kinase inhibitor-like YbhB/YbcL family protein